MLIRKTMLIRDRIESDVMGKPCARLTRVVALAVLRNPFSGIDQDDLTELLENGATLGARLAAEAVAALGAAQDTCLRRLLWRTGQSRAGCLTPGRRPA